MQSRPKNQLSKTILYNLNPADNEVMATMLGNLMMVAVKVNTMSHGGF